MHSVKGIHSRRSRDLVNLVDFGLHTYVRKTVSYTNFPAKYRILQQIYRLFPQTDSLSLEYSKSFPIQRFVRRTDNYPILKTFIFFITKRRFGGVEAQEGREIMPEIHTGFFRKPKTVQCFCRKPMHIVHIFPQKYQNFSKQSGNTGANL